MNKQKKLILDAKKGFKKRKISLTKGLVDLDEMKELARVLLSFDDNELQKISPDALPMYSVATPFSVMDRIDPEYTTEIVCEECLALIKKTIKDKETTPDEFDLLLELEGRYSGICSYYNDDERMASTESIPVHQSDIVFQSIQIINIGLTREIFKLALSSIELMIERVKISVNNYNSLNLK